MDDMASPVREPVAVTLLTGFLGAGKTTLLNHLLHGEHGFRIAVVENEFGPVNIDSELLTERAAGIVEMTNGCLCCTINGELADSLLDMIARRDAGELVFDRLVIETTGVADPAPVVQTFFADPALREAFLLDAVITVVDAAHAARQLDEMPVVQKQIGFADRLLLSKTDLVADDALPELIERIVAINPRAPLLTLAHGAIDWNDILDIRGFNLNDTLLAEETRQAAAPRFRSLGQARPVSFRSRRGDEIASLLLEHEGRVDLEKIGAFVQDLIDRHGDNLLRYKGVLAVPEQAQKLVFQGVCRVAGFDLGAPWGDEPARSRIVVIGRQLPVAELRSGFADCCLPVAG